MTRSALAADALRQASRVRSRVGVDPGSAVCPFDVALKLGIRVAIQRSSSLEGAYSPGPPAAIVIGSERPAGRRRFTCAHELGHHVFGHGFRLDEVGEVSAQSDDEFLADAFAGALLMPILAVRSAFVRRSWSFTSCTPEQAFIVAQDLGVGYTTLITHASRALNLISTSRAAELKKRALPSIRESFGAEDSDEDVFPIDAHWGMRPLDVELGDLIILPPGSMVIGPALAMKRARVCAERVGRAQLQVPGRPAPIEVRTSRPGFSGLARYRHMEDSGDE